MQSVAGITTPGHRSYGESLALLLHKASARMSRLGHMDGLVALIVILSSFSIVLGGLAWSSAR